MSMTATANRSTPSAPRGATLIELMVSLALLAVVLGVAVGLVAGAIQSAARGRARGELARQGNFVNALLSNELRMAGLGVPMATGNHIADGYDGVGPTNFDSFVILAQPTVVGIVADLPRPDAQYSTFGLLNSRPTGVRNAVMWHTENNGSCAPDTVGPTCTTQTTSIFFPGVDGCDAPGDVNERLCPWGMKRARAGERLQIVDGAHRWTHAGVADPLAMSSLSATGALALNLSTTWDSFWANTTTTDLPGAVTGQGFVTTIDRLFYRLNGSNLERNQCWGDPDPDDANWPNLAATALPASLISTPATGEANECSGFEVVAKNVTNVVFEYFDNSGVTTTNKAQIARIDWTITLRKTVNGRTVQQDIVGTVALRN